MWSIADSLGWFDFGDVPTWLATVAAIWGAWWAYGRWRADVETDRARDAERVWAVIEDGEKRHHLRARVVNSSSAVIYHVAVVITSGPDVQERCALVALAPGGEHLTEDFMWARGQQATAHVVLGSTRPVVISDGLGVAVYFTDVHEQRWHRDWQGRLRPDVESKAKFAARRSRR